MLEKDIEKKVKAYAKSKGWLVFKFSSPAHRGVPDGMFIRDGRVFFIEFKQLGKKATKLQQITIDKIICEDIKVFVCDSVEQGKGIVDAQSK